MGKARGESGVSILSSADYQFTEMRSFFRKLLGGVILKEGNEREG